MKKSLCSLARYIKSTGGELGLNYIYIASIFYFKFKDASSLSCSVPMQNAVESQVIMKVSRSEDKKPSESTSTAVPSVWLVACLARCQQFSVSR